VLGYMNTSANQTLLTKGKNWWTNTNDWARSVSW